MQRYVAFLRGINVGGRTVTKTQLQEAFTSLGYLDVSTFKQSGNVIFETDASNTAEIRCEIEQKLQAMLGYEVAVFVRTIEQLKNTVNQAAPFKSKATEGASFLVTFLSNEPATIPFTLPLTIPKSTAQIISTQGTEVFSVTHGGGEGALPNPFLEKMLKAKATTRNFNVVAAIVEKYGCV